jgi:diguanylate cyclase (GGDEF)-like protein
VGLRTVHLQEELQRKTRTQQVLNTQLEAVNRRLDHLSITDDLTGLFNRRHAMVRLQEHWALAERHGQPLCVAMVDIDHFKKVNDTFGHDAGDVVLHQVADILRCSTRSTDLTCRMGGEEFLILFPLQSVNDATACAERCRTAVAEHVFRVGSAEIRATISIGVAGITTAMTHFPELLRAADRMLYFAKTNGRNRVQSAQPIPDGAAAQQPLALAANGDANAAAPATFDPNSILARCGGDSDFAAAVAEKFCKQAPSEMTRLEESLTTNNTEAFRRAARNVKSMATVVSARAALDLAARLERIARSGQLADAPPLVQHLQQEIDSVVISITGVGNQSRQKCA